MNSPVDGFRRHLPETQPHAVVQNRLTFGEELPARQIGDPGRHYFRQKGGGAEAPGQRQPGEKPAVGVDPADAFGHMGRQAVHHGVAPFAVNAADVIAVPGVQAPVEKFGADDLGQDGGHGVQGGFDVVHPVDDFFFRVHIAQAAAGGENFRKAVGVNDVAGAVETFDGRQGYLGLCRKHNNHALYSV